MRTVRLRPTAKPLLLLGAFCAVVGLLNMDGAASERATAPAKVTIREVLKNREKWRNQIVQVSGYYFSGPEVSALYESRDDAVRARDSKGLWIGWGAKPGQESKIKWVRKGQVRVIGRFEYGSSGSGHFGRWPGQIVELELMEPIPIESGRTNATREGLSDS